MDTFDWSAFTTRIAVKAPMENLYSAWATQQGMEYWFLRLSEFCDSRNNVRSRDQFVEKGDTYHWRWHGWPDDVEERGVLISCNGKDAIAFSFGKAGNCFVTLKQHGTQVLVELIQRDIPDDDTGKHNWHLGCKTGWTFYLANLKSLYEGGIDLRNKDVALHGVINA